MDTRATSSDYSCFDKLKSLMEKERNGLFKDVEIIIKPTRIYKANQKKKKMKSISDSVLNTQIKNALEGMHKLMNVDIKFDKMNEDDWNYLRRQMVQVNATTCNEQFHRSSRRKALDDKIDDFLTKLGGGRGGGAGYSGTTSGGTGHSGTTSCGTGHSGGGSSSSCQSELTPRRTKEKEKLFRKKKQKKKERKAESKKFEEK